MFYNHLSLSEKSSFCSEILVEQLEDEDENVSGQF